MLIDESFINVGDTMKIIISPAKKMRVDNDTFVPLSKPAFLDKTVKIKEELLKMDLYDALEKLDDKEKISFFQTMINNNR